MLKRLIYRDNIPSTRQNLGFKILVLFAQHLITGNAYLESEVAFTCKYGNNRETKHITRGNCLVFDLQDVYIVINSILLTQMLFYINMK